MIDFFSALIILLSALSLYLISEIADHLVDTLPSYSPINATKIFIGCSVFAWIVCIIEGSILLVWSFSHILEKVSQHG